MTVSPWKVFFPSLSGGGGLFSFPLSPLKWSLFALYMKTSSKLLAVGGQRVHYASAIG